jgi:hypothetical protein
MAPAVEADNQDALRSAVELLQETGQLEDAIDL